MSKMLGQIPLTFVDLQYADGVATLCIQRPSSGNALNWALLEQLRAALRRAVDANEVEAIVIAASGPRFISGADLNFFVRCLDRGDMARVVDCIRASQEVFDEIAACPKPTVAAVGGAAVGGGVELALACHKIVATPRASFSFPETSLGILPFSGGTYRLHRRTGIGLAKWLVYTGHVLLAPKALRIGLADQLVMPTELSESAQSMARALCGVRPVESPPTTPAVEFSELEDIFACTRVADLFAAGTEGAIAVADRTIATALKALSARSLTTLQAAESLFNAAATATPSQSAQAALALVPELFGSCEVYSTLARAAAEQQQSAAGAKESPST